MKARSKLPASAALDNPQPGSHGAISRAYASQELAAAVALNHIVNQGLQQGRALLGAETVTLLVRIERRIGQLSRQLFPDEVG